MRGRGWRDDPFAIHLRPRYSRPSSRLPVPGGVSGDIRRRSRDLAPQDRAFVKPARWAPTIEEIAYTDAATEAGVLRDGLSAGASTGDENLFASSRRITARNCSSMAASSMARCDVAGTVARAPRRVGTWASPRRWVGSPCHSPCPWSTSRRPSLRACSGLTSPSPFDGHGPSGQSLSGRAHPYSRSSRTSLFRRGRAPAGGDRAHQPQSAVVHWPHKLIVNHQEFRSHRGVRPGTGSARAQRPRRRGEGNDRCVDRPLVPPSAGGRQDIDRATDHLPAAPDPAVLERLRALGYVRVNSDVGPRLFDREFPCYANEEIGAGPVSPGASEPGSRRWTTPTRRVHEQTLGLTRAAHHEGSTWRYRVPEASPDRLRTIVNHEMVEDPHTRL